MNTVEDHLLRIAASLESLLEIEKRRFEDEQNDTNGDQPTPAVPAIGARPRGRPRKAVEAPAATAAAVAATPAFPAPAPTPVPAPEPQPEPPAPAPAPTPAPAPPPTAQITHDTLRHAARPVVVRGDIPVLQKWLDRNFGVPSIGGIPEDRLAEAMVKLQEIL